MNNHPLLEDFPPAPPGKRGWPWTEPGRRKGGDLPTAENLPRISIVTPNYNYGEFLEATIRSVLLQGYPKLEYIVVDGGSTDDSLAILNKYQDFLSLWISRKDEGQSDAINHGFEYATGEIMYWLNSDDMLQPNTLLRVSALFTDPRVMWIAGGCEIIDKRGRTISKRVPDHLSAATFLRYPTKWIPQQSVFWRSQLWRVAGPLRVNHHFAMDFFFLLGLFKECKPLVTRETISFYRYHRNAKALCVENKLRLFSEMLDIIDDSLPFFYSSISIRSTSTLLGIEVLKQAIIMAIKLRPKDGARLIMRFLRMDHAGSCLAFSRFVLTLLQRN